MKAFFVVCLGVVLAGWCCGQSRAQPKARDTKTIEAELDRFRDDLFHAFNEEKYQEMLEKYCHKDVIATWQDGTTSKGHEGVLAEFTKLKKFINKMTVNPNTDKRLILNDGNLVIASGNMKDEYAMSDGSHVKLDSRWAATLVWENDRWILVGFDASTNAFDNQVIDLYSLKAKYTTYISAAVAAVVGLLVGIVGTLLVKKRRPV